MSADIVSLSDFIKIFLSPMYTNATPEKASKIYDVITRNFNVDELEYLDNDDFGDTGLIIYKNKEVVLKLTTDDYEVKSATAIQGINLEYVVEIYEAYFFANLSLTRKDDNSVHNVGIILEEYLPKLYLKNRAEADFLETTVDNIKNKYNIWSNQLASMQEHKRRELLKMGMEELIPEVKNTPSRSSLPLIAIGLEELYNQGIYMVQCYGIDISRTKDNIPKIMNLGDSSPPSEHEVPEVRNNPRFNYGYYDVQE